MDTTEFFLMTSKGLPSNLYGYEVRFRQKEYELDERIVSCPIKRTACTYAGDFLIGCEAALDETFLAGYHVNVEVKRAYRNKIEYNAVDDDLVDDDDYPSKWWSVVSCEVRANEVGHAPDWFEESIKFYWTPKQYIYAWYMILGYIAGSSLFFFAAFVVFFAEECIICSRKNAFLSRDRMCLVCRALGSPLPHPEIIARLDAEKAARLLKGARLMKASWKEYCRWQSLRAGVAQMPPLTWRTAKLATWDLLLSSAAAARATGWRLAGWLSCGKVKRWRRPGEEHMSLARFAREAGDSALGACYRAVELASLALTCVTLGKVPRWRRPAPRARIAPLQPMLTNGPRGSVAFSEPPTPLPPGLPPGPNRAEPRSGNVLVIKPKTPPQEASL
mmetsp:Transcript_11281/g.26508  ORF Transcript_11281/g.26508 Transcript_11281/m.26508 type:complete len:389 (+) Transcript_11281:606-1772(+)